MDGLNARDLDRHITGNGGEDQFRRSIRWPRCRFYLGLRGSMREVFSSIDTPTEESHPFTAVIGPFRTKRGALYMRDNRHCVTVAAAEKAAKVALAPSDK